MCVCVRVCVCVCVEQFGAVIRAWAPNPRVAGSSPGLGLAVVILSKSLYPHCFSQPIRKTGTWPCAGVDMIIDCENIPYSGKFSYGTNFRIFRMQVLHVK